MQRKVSTSYGGGGNANNSQISSQLCNKTNHVEDSSLYSSIFPPNSSTENNNQFPQLTQYSANQYQDLINRHNSLLSQLLNTNNQAQFLRQENINLRISNLNLTNRVSLLLQSNNSLQNEYGTTSYSISNDNEMSSEVSDSFGKLCISGDYEVSSSEEHESPTSVFGSNRVENTGSERFSLPKSISVRSSGYLKTARAANRIRTATEKQRVYLPGGKTEEQRLELDVYNQGMLKTELCNKWQQTGSCPYGAQCQFAHGIDELRPVLRHPRYKTEVCRMLLNGDTCPYSHRCHFRHSLTDGEKLIAMDSIRSRGSLRRPTGNSSSVKNPW